MTKPILILRTNCRIDKQSITQLTVGLFCLEVDSDTLTAVETCLLRDNCQSYVPNN